MKMALLLALVLLCSCCSAWAEDEAAYELMISEAQSNNDTDWSLGFYDYIELYNGGDSAVMLSDYFLTRDEAEPFSCHLPAMELAPDSYVLLICDVDLRDLRLPKEGCELYLYHRDGTLCDDVELPEMENNVWQAEAGLTNQPSPGYANTAEGAAAYRASYMAGQTLVINEVVSSNSKLLPQNEEYNDLIELSNVGSETINLNDYYLSDKKKNPFLWQMPHVQLAPGEVYVIQASGNQNAYEAPFKIPATGEAIYISDKNGQCIDALYVPPLTPDTSYGRSGSPWVILNSRPSAGRIRKARPALRMYPKQALAAARSAGLPRWHSAVRVRFTIRLTAESLPRKASATTVRPSALKRVRFCALVPLLTVSSGQVQRRATICSTRKSMSFRCCASAVSPTQSWAPAVFTRCMKSATVKRSLTSRSLKMAIRNSAWTVA